MRGQKQREAVARANDVVAGINNTERNPYVLSVAADIVLSDSLRARKIADKHGILSHRQMKRRVRREVYLTAGYPEYTPRTAPSGTRGARARHAGTASWEDLRFDAS